MPISDYGINKAVQLLNNSGAKFTSVNQASADKQASMAPQTTLSPEQSYTIAAGIASGRGRDSASGLEADIRNLNDYELSQKYGSSVAEDLIKS